MTHNSIGGRHSAAPNGTGGSDSEEMGEGSDTSDGGPQMRGGLCSELVEHDCEERCCEAAAWGVPTHW
jgi:hypothetical protein